MGSMTPLDRPRGWALIADRSTPGAGRSIERFGLVYRHPLPLDGDDTMVAGQPCMLLQVDTSRVVGLWAIGEVVAEPLHLPASFAWSPAELPLLAEVPDGDPPERRWAEVELLPLEKPLPIDRLASHRDLASSPLVDARVRPPAPGPMPLSSAEVRAIESFDAWLVEPDPEARRALDDLLEAEEHLLP
jgi:hypothetical protein